MDRSLDPDLLRIALGGAAGLPTAEELMEQLASTEVELFKGEQSVSDPLLTTAWFLHSVGSALPALDLYGPDRQRTAFQVAAHVFDLALGDDRFTEIERLRFTFASQTANIRSGLNPNAIAAYRWRNARQDPAQLLTSTSALQIGTALLAYDTAWLFSNLRRLRDEVARMRVEWDLEPTETIFGAQAHLVEGAWGVLVYLVYGNTRDLDAACARLEQAVRASASVDDLDSRWVAFHLWQLCRDLGSSSLWAVLPPDTPPAVPRSFTLARPCVLTLWPPQVELLDRSRHPYALDPAVRRLVLSIPTSAGKTLLAQLLAANHLVREGTGVCFVAPTRSLCREIEASLRRRLRLLANASEVLFADWMFSDVITEEPQVEVMTPERLAYLMRTDPAAVMARFGLFIIDEAHSVSDPSRGWTLEWVLSCIHKMSEDTGHRIVVMSAALGNRATLATWLDPRGQGLRYFSTWRGPRRLHSIYTTVRREESAVRLPTPTRASPVRTRYDLHGALHLRPTASGRIHTLETTQPIGTLVVRAVGNQRDTALSTPFYKTLAPIARLLGRAGPVLVISPTKVEASRLAREIASQIESLGGPAWLVELTAVRLGRQHPLVDCLRHGVAYHHASLPGDVLLGIEEEVANETIRFVVATTTLTEGVNLPVRTVIIAAQGSHGADGYQEFITGARLLNAIGRAGRAGKESEGWIVLARNDAFNRADFARLTPGEEDIPVESVLALPAALEQLALLEDAIRLGTDVAIQRVGSTVENFLSYVWYLASVAEDAGELPAARLQPYLEATLAWQEFTPAMRTRWASIAEEALVSYQGRSAAVRRRWSRAGTTLPTASAIESLTEEVLAEVTAHPEANPTVVQLLDLLAGQGRIERLMDLPESGTPVPRNQRGGRGTARIALDMLGLLKAWVAGGDIQDLADGYLGAVADPEFRLEQLADFITAAFDNFLPWAFGLVIEWVNARLEGDQNPDVAIPASLPFLVRYGVNSRDAVRLIRGGVVSRRLATVVAEDFQANGDGEQDLREWLCGMDLAVWRARFAASPMDLRAMLEFARPRGHRLAARLLGGDLVTIQIRAVGEPRASETAVFGDVADEPPPARLGVWAAGELLGVVPPEHSAELDAIRGTGIPMAVSLAVQGDQLQASVQLTDLTARSGEIT